MQFSLMSRHLKKRPIDKILAPLSIRSFRVSITSLTWLLVHVGRCCYCQGSLAHWWNLRACDLSEASRTAFCCLSSNLTMSACKGEEVWLIDEISKPVVHWKLQGLQPILIPDYECVEGVLPRESGSLRRSPSQWSVRGCRVCTPSSYLTTSECRGVLSLKEFWLINEISEAVFH